MKTLSRRSFLSETGACAAALATGCATHGPSGSHAARRPNVIILLTDDQGYGDLGCHGNPDIRTPNLDRMYAASTRLERFHSMPVCSPTRACLMTGRYHYRTGVVDTYLGRSMMDASEVTLAEVFAKNGYRTGIFGKWHLGDHYPLRAMDRGFQESLTIEGGGMVQPSDPPGGNHYQDPLLKHNGVLKQYPGYCSDVYTEAALQFIEASKDSPFFVYLPFNAPHTPLEVPEKYVRPYLDKGLPEFTAKVYAMVENIDENVGRVMAKLDALQLREQTLVIFMTDNGPYWGQNGPVRYNAGMRGQKGTVYEGGTRVPCFAHWPGTLQAGRACAPIASFIDWMPTLIEACGLSHQGFPAFDGQNLWPVLRGADAKGPDRTLFLQWHRGNEPEPFRNSAVLEARYKLVDGKELYDLVQDPGEQQDIATANPAVTADLRGRYERWFADVSSTRGYAPVRPEVGTPHENPVLLTQQDWRADHGFGEDKEGGWEVHVARDGSYRVRIDFPPVQTPARAFLRMGDSTQQAEVAANAGSHVFGEEQWRRGNLKIEAWVEQNVGKRTARYAYVERTT